MQNLSQNQFKYLLRILKNRHFKKNQQKAFIEGEKIILELIRDRKELIEYAVCSPEFNNKIPNVPICSVKDYQLDRLSSQKKVFTLAALINTKELNREMPKSIKGINVGLVNIQDPINLGAIFRTSLAFGVKNIFLMANCADPTNQKAVIASTGAVFRLPFYKLESPEELQNKYKNIKFIGTDVDEGKDYRTLEEQNVIILFGNEGVGLGKKVLGETDLNIKIPIKNIDSLNVSVSVGIILSHISNIK